MWVTFSYKHVSKQQHNHVNKQQYNHVSNIQLQAHE